MKGRALVTGGTGFVGANLVRQLLSDGSEVHLLVRPEARTWRLSGIESELRLHTANIDDAQSVDAVFAKARPDWVFHLAAHGAYSFENDYVAMARTNVLGAAQMIAAASGHGCGALVLAGSSAEYGDPPAPPAETAPLAPNNHYAVTKAAATGLATVAAADPGSCPIVVLRLYSVYGPWEEPRRLMPTLLLQALDGRWPPLAAPDTMRDFLFVTDAVEALLLAARGAADRRGQIYNIGSGVGTTLKELVAVVGERMQVLTLPDFGTHPGRPWDARMSWVSDPRLAARELGWEATTSIGDGIAQFAVWLVRNREHYSPHATPTDALPGLSR